jgi:hypothetical protein
MRYETSAAGFGASMAQTTTYADFVVFRESSSARARVAARSVERFAIGRFLRGEPQARGVNFSLPRSNESRDVPAGSFYVP